MNSALVTGYGEVALKTPVNSRLSTLANTMRDRSAMWIQLMYCRPLPTCPPRNQRVSFPSSSRKPTFGPSTTPSRKQTLSVLGASNEYEADSHFLQTSV